MHRLCHRFFFQYFVAPGFKDFGNRVVKQLNDMGFLSAKEVSNDVVEYTLGDTNIRISPQGYSLGSNQFIMVGTSFSACDFGVKPEKAKNCRRAVPQPVVPNKPHCSVGG